MSLQRITLPLDTLGCAASAVPVEHALRAVPGVTQVFVNPVTEMAYVEYDRDRCQERAIREALVESGYRSASAHEAPAELPGRRGRLIGRLVAAALGVLRRSRQPATRHPRNRKETQ